MKVKDQMLMLIRTKLKIITAKMVWMKLAQIFHAARLILQSTTALSLGLK